MNENLAKNVYPADRMAKIQDADHVSLMAQTMTPELFEKYKGHKTASGGWTVARAMNTGVEHPSSFVGCHIGDLESLQDYKELFHPVIEKYHVGFKMDGSCKHITDVDVSKVEGDLSESAKSKIVSTRIRFARNLSFFPLNPAASKENRINILEVMKEVVSNLEGDLAGTLHEHAKMTDAERQALIDGHFLFRGGDVMQAASGYHQYWPHGRGVYLNHDRTFVMWINEGDHIRIISMEQGGDVKSVFGRLGRAHNAIKAGLEKVAGDLIPKNQGPFMMHPICGSVSCCPSNIGTGMRGGVHILVPKLIAKIGLEGIDKIARSMYCQARGSSGEHSEVIDKIDISHWRRLGRAEYELLADMMNCANKISDMEDAL